MDTLINYWDKHCRLKQPQLDWLTTHAQVLSVTRGKQLFAPGDRPDYLYVVTEGLLAGIHWNAHGQRRIRCLALPVQGIMTLRNLYTHKQVEHVIVALRRSTVIRIPTAAMRDYKENCTEGDILVDVIRDRQERQLRQQNALILMPDEIKRYIRFYHSMSEIRSITSQQEQADYLNISRVSITRAMRRIVQAK